MKKNTFRDCIIATVCILTQVAMAADNGQVPPPLSALFDELLYGLNQGQALPPPGTRLKTFKVQAHFRAGWSFSCGEFDMYDNVAQMMSQLENSVRRLPDQVTAAATSAIATLPTYLIKKANASLYGMLTRTEDHMINLFEMSYKTCQEMEREMWANKENPDFNPYNGFLQAAIADQWILGDRSKPIDEIDKDAVEKANEEGLQWLNGERYGGKGQKKIDINVDIAMAGYNHLIGRTKANDESAPSSPYDEHYIVSIFPTPRSVGEWLNEIVGGSEISLDKNEGSPVTNGGTGLRREVAELADFMRSALKKAVYEDLFADLRKYRVAQVSPQLVTVLRGLQPMEQSLFIERLAGEMAIIETQNKVMQAKQILHSGLQDPNVNTSSAQQIAHQQIRQRTIPMLDEALNDIHKDLAIQNQTFNSTALSAFQLLRAKAAQSSQVQVPSVPQSALESGVIRK